jgi:hypothetical protein
MLRTITRHPGPIQADHPVLCCEPLDDGRADEPAAAGDENCAINRFHGVLQHINKQT